MSHFYRPKEKYLVVAPKKSIFQSWIDDASKFGYESLLGCIEFTTYLSMTKKNPRDYAAIYLDECHSLRQHMSMWLVNFGGRILGLTGTPPREFSEKGQMVTAYCPIVYRYSTKDAVEDKILNDYKIVLHKLPLNSSRTLKKTTKLGKEWYTSEAAEYTYWSDRVDRSVRPADIKFNRIQRMRAMMNFTSKEEYAKKLFAGISDKCILFANTMDQADRLCRDSYHSNNHLSEENLQNFKEGRIKKLSAVLQLNEGVNIPNLKSCIILHSYSSNTKSAQRIGRCLRLNPDEVATINILVYKNTIDEIWTEEALKEFDPQKISSVTV